MLSIKKIGCYEKDFLIFFLNCTRLIHLSLLSVTGDSSGWLFLVVRKNILKNNFCENYFNTIYCQDRHDV